MNLRTIVVDDRTMDMLGIPANQKIRDEVRQCLFEISIHYGRPLSEDRLRFFYYNFLKNRAEEMDRFYGKEVIFPDLDLTD